MNKSKRPEFDLSSITASVATPMAEAVQRVAAAPEKPKLPKSITEKAKIPAGELDNLNFKVPPDTKKRFKIAAAVAGLYQYELLEAALDLWEAKNPSLK